MAGTKTRESLIFGYRLPPLWDMGLRCIGMTSGCILSIEGGRGEGGALEHFWRVAVNILISLVCHYPSKRGGHKVSYGMNDLIRALRVKTTWAKKGKEKATENKMKMKKKSGQKRGVWYLIHPCPSRHITKKSQLKEKNKAQLESR